MTGEDVKELQKYLNANGFVVAKSGVGSVGKETNYFGAATKTALLKYQKAKGLRQTGMLDEATRVLLNNTTSLHHDITTSRQPDITTSPTANYVFKNLLKYGQRSEEVKQLQLRLQELGYLDENIKVNGIFGPATKAAVIKLQKEYQLTPALGYTGPGTREVLNKD